MNGDLEVSQPMIGNYCKSQKFKQYIATISASLGIVCAGTILAWSSPALSQLIVDENDNSTSTKKLSVSEGDGAWVGSVMPIGALISAVPIGYLSEKIGRRLTMLLLIIPFTLNWIFIIAAQNLAMLIIGRFCGGIGVGGIFVLAPMYIGEISEDSLRPILGSFIPIFLAVGILFTCILGSFTSWFVLSILLSIMPVVFGVCLYFMPETPIYLVENDNSAQAEIVLRDLRGSSYDIKTELKDIQRHLQGRHSGVSVKEIFTTKAYRKSFLIGIGVLSFQQLCGINAVIFYTSSIFDAAGTNISPNVAAIIINLVQVISSYFSILLIERANRKFYLLFSSAGMFTCLTFLGLFFHLKEVAVDTERIGFMPLTSMVVFIISFCLGFGPVPWLLLSELYAPEIKGLATGSAITFNWFSAFMVTLCFPLLKVHLGPYYTFYIFGMLNAIGILFVYLCVPETRGKSLDEIQDALSK